MGPHAPRQKSHGRTERQTSCYTGKKTNPIWLKHSSQNSGMYIQMQSYLYTLSITVEKITQNLKGIWVNLRSKYIRVQD